MIGIIISTLYLANIWVRMLESRIDLSFCIFVPTCNQFKTKITNLMVPLCWRNQLNNQHCINCSIFYNFAVKIVSTADGRFKNESEKKVDAQKAYTKQTPISICVITLPSFRTLQKFGLSSLSWSRNRRATEKIKGSSKNLPLNQQQLPFDARHRANPLFAREDLDIIPGWEICF